MTDTIRRKFEEEKMTPEQFKQITDEMLAAEPPPGFEKKIVDYEWQGEVLYRNVTFLKHKPDGSRDIEFIVSVPVKMGSTYMSKLMVDGTTNFSTKLGERTFDRAGVDSSFYIHTAGELPTVIQEQMEKIEKSRSRIENSVIIPGMPGNFTCDPDLKKKITEALNTGKTWTLAPAGFGTGYKLMTTRPRHRYFKTGTKELCSFFGVKSIYLESFDHD